MSKKDDIQSRITTFWSTIASGYEAHGGNVPARYVDTPVCGLLPYWVESDTDALGSVSVPTEMWQYAVECHRYGGESDGAFDLNAAKPPVYPWTGTDRVSRIETPAAGEKAYAR